MAAFLVLVVLATTFAVLARPGDSRQLGALPARQLHDACVVPMAIPAPGWVRHSVELPAGTYVSDSPTRKAGWNRAVIVVPLDLAALREFAFDRWRAAGMLVSQQFPIAPDQMGIQFARAHSVGSLTAVPLRCSPGSSRAVLLFKSAIRPPPNGGGTGNAPPEGPPSDVCPAVPVYPLAISMPRHRDGALLRAVNRAPGVSHLTGMNSFSLGTSAWLGGNGAPDAFEYYSERMNPVDVAEMPASTRRAIGVRPSGPVDSPPLLYVSKAGAALLRGTNGGVVLLTLFCGPAVV